MWNYKAQDTIDSGYEDIWDYFGKWTSEEFLSSSEEKQKEMIEEIFKVYRERNIPCFLNYYNEKGIQEEIVKCYKKDYSSQFNGEIMTATPTLGQGILRYLFPSMQDVICKDVLNNSLLDRFNDDHKLKRAIDFCLRFRKRPPYPSNMKDSLEMIGGNKATNFLSMRVKMLVDFYMKDNEKFFDYSCGFGARMLGVLTSKKKLKYYGCEPNTKTFEELINLHKLIKSSIETQQVALMNQGSEVDLPLIDNESIDFSFSSPPYFTLEKYCNEPTQSVVKYPILEDWLEGYVRGTIKNIYRILKKDKYYAVNIADFKLGNECIHFVDKWIEISIQEGFTFDKEIPLKLGKSRPNNLSQTNTYLPKVESIYVFKKKA